MDCLRSILFTFSPSTHMFCHRLYFLFADKPALFERHGDGAFFDEASQPRYYMSLRAAGVFFIYP